MFDTLNAKAAIYAALDACSTRAAVTLPLAISGTITDASGRVLSGQTPEAFWNSIRHAQPLFIGLNCALGRAAAAALRRRSSRRVADTYVCAYPNAGLPNAFGEYDEGAARDGARSCASSASPGWSISWVAAAARRPSTSA